MNPRIEISRYQIGSGYEKEILNLVRNVFDEYCSADCDQFGLKVFYDFIEEYNFTERNQTNCATFIAKVGEAIAGVLEIRDNNHICLLFVDNRFHGMGIAKMLMYEAINLAKTNSVIQVDVNASLFSEKIYEKLGFRKTDEAQEINGIRFYPMVIDLN
jgi:GNAT superfamily N-acetyltransferase